MTHFKESLIFDRELQLLTDEYQTAPDDIKNYILKDIQLIETAMSLLDIQDDAQ